MPRSISATLAAGALFLPVVAGCYASRLELSGDAADPGTADRPDTPAEDAWDDTPTEVADDTSADDAEAATEDAPAEDAAAEDAAADVPFSPSWIVETASGRDEVTGIALRGDGNIVVTGMRDGMPDVEWTMDRLWVMTLGPDGHVVQRLATSRILGVRNGGPVALPDGGLVLLGTSLPSDTGSTDVWLARTDSAGAIVWQRTYGRPRGDAMPAVAVHPDGALTLVAASGLPGYSEPPTIWLARIAADGTLGSQVGVEHRYSQDCPAVAVGPDGRTYVSTYSLDWGPTDLKTWIAALDDDGAIVWQRLIAGESGWSKLRLQAADAGGLLLVGRTDGSGFPECASWIVRLSLSGELLWQKAFTSGGCDIATIAVPMGASGYLLAGQADSVSGLAYGSWFGVLGPDGTLSTPGFLRARSDRLHDTSAMLLGDGLMIAAADGDATAPTSPSDVIIARLPLPGAPSRCDSSESVSFEDILPAISITDGSASSSAADGTAADAAVAFDEESVPIDSVCGE